MKKKTAAFIATVVVLIVVVYFTLPNLLVYWASESERKAAGLQEKTLRVGDHEIVYLEGGKGEVILAMHGFGANKDNWTRFAKFISPNYRVLALDLPGFGESTCLEDGSYSIEEQAKRLSRFADALGLQKFHIFGNSMGGHIAGRYTIMFLDRVLTLGLFNTAGAQSPVPSEMIKKISRDEPNPLVAGSVEEFDRLIQFVFSTPPDIPRLVKKPLVEEAKRHKTSNERIFKQIHDEMSALESDLGKIKARTFVLWGDQDRVLDVSSVEVLKNGLPDATTVIMKACGHLPMIERPQEAVEHYLSFLKGK